MSGNDVVRGVALTTFEERMRFSMMVAKSEFAPKDFRGKPESVFLAIEHGAELGLSKMQSLQSIAVVNGRPSVYGDTALAVCRASPLCESVHESIQGDGDAMVAVCVVKRRGDPVPVEQRYGVLDAKRAGLWGKAGPWAQYPRRMLQMRARGFALRDAFPDLLRGLITSEEAQDYQDPEAPEIAAAQPRARQRMKALPAPAAATESLADKARAAIENAKTDAELAKCENAVKRYAGDGKLTAEETAKLTELARARRESLASVATCQEFRKLIAAAATSEALATVVDQIDRASADGLVDAVEHESLLTLMRDRQEQITEGGA